MSSKTRAHVLASLAAAATIVSTIRFDRTPYHKGHEVELARELTPEQYESLRERGLLTGDWDDLLAAVNPRFSKEENSGLVDTPPQAGGDIALQVAMVQRVVGRWDDLSEEAKRFILERYQELSQLIGEHDLLIAPFPQAADLVLEASVESGRYDRFVEVGPEGTRVAGMLRYLYVGEFHGADDEEAARAALLSTYQPVAAVAPVTAVPLLQSDGEKADEGEQSAPAAPFSAPPGAPGAPLPEGFPGRKHLIAAGYTTIEAVRPLTLEQLIAVSGIGEHLAKQILATLADLAALSQPQAAAQ